MLRRTKILTTLGPATDNPKVLADLIRAGADVVRINFSHGEPEFHAKRVQMVREAAEQVGKWVAVLGDLQGPKIRIERFVEGKVFLNEGDPFTLDISLDSNAGTQKSVGVAYKSLPQDVRPGDTLLLNDGLIVLDVTEVDGPRIHTRVVVGGELSNNKGINKQGGGLSAGALTDKDREDIKLAAQLGVDYLAVSFARDGSDMEEARRLLRKEGGHGHLVAKIERSEALVNLDRIIMASDAVMVARGDLGVEVGNAELTGLQKHIIAETRKRNRVVITATQMMESMISSSLPTRAEVSDVANAVLDDTDAVMLSAESASGQYPVEAVQAMARICLGAEKHPTTTRSHHRLGETFSRCDETIALAAMYAANHFPGVKAIIALTESGHTPLIMSRIRSGVPIYCYTRHQSTQNRAALFRGVYTVPFDPTAYDPSELSQAAIGELKRRGKVQPGDWVILTKGDYYQDSGGTNGMKILKVE